MMITAQCALRTAVESIEDISSTRLWAAIGISHWNGLVPPAVMAENWSIWWVFVKERLHTNDVIPACNYFWAINLSGLTLSYLQE